jgi:hypothetical protein
MFGAPNSGGKLLAADRALRVVGQGPRRTRTVAAIEDEQGFLASLGITVSRLEMTALMSGLNTREESSLFL